MSAVECSAASDADFCWCGHGQPGGGIDRRHLLSQIDVAVEFWRHRQHPTKKTGESAHGSSDGSAPATALDARPATATAVTTIALPATTHDGTRSYLIPATMSPDIACELRAPGTPVMLPAGRDVEVSVVPANTAVVLIERAVAALGLIAVTDHRSRIAAAQRRRAEHPKPGAVVDQQLHVRIGVVPLPPTQLRSAPHGLSVHARRTAPARGDRSVHGDRRRSQEPRHRPRVRDTCRDGRPPASARRCRPEPHPRRRARWAPAPCSPPASPEVRWPATSPIACCRRPPSRCTCSRLRRRCGHGNAPAGQRGHRMPCRHPVADFVARVEGV